MPALQRSENIIEKANSGVTFSIFTAVGARIQSSWKCMCNQESYFKNCIAQLCLYLKKEGQINAFNVCTPDLPQVEIVYKEI